MQPVFAFFNPWVALAAAVVAVAVPIVIHLLNRRRFRIVVWAAMRFLLNAQKQNTRRMRLEQIILLAVRATLALLIVVAMASITGWANDWLNNLFPGGARTARHRSTRIHKIIVLDASLSMAVKADGGKTLFERGRDFALQIVRESDPGDGLSVALMKDVPTWVIGEPALQPKRVVAEVENVQQSHGNANVAATLNMVAAKLAESGRRFDTREVYFITDMQRSTWLGARAQEGGKDGKTGREKSALQEIQKNAQTIFLDVGRDNVTNVAVTNVALGDNLIVAGATVPVLATVHNFGPDPRPKLAVELLVGRAPEKAGDPAFALRPVAQELVNLPPGHSKPVPFLHKFTEPGTYAVQVRVEEDDLPIDDSRTVILTVRDKIPALLVNGKQSVDRFETATGYLRLALNPGGDFPTPIRPRVDTVSQFAAKVNDGKLADYDCVYLCDVSRLAPDDVRGLETHLRRGGGLVVFLGEHTAGQLEGYNRLLHKGGEGLLPARLVAVEEGKRDYHFILHADDEAFREPPLKAFADDDNRPTLTRPRFHRYVRAEVPGDASVRTILSFIPEARSETAKVDKNAPARNPAILEWNPPLPTEERARARADREKAGQRGGPAGPSRYRGKVILVTTTANLDWNSWAGSPSYIPLMQELFRVAVAGKLREHAVTVGGVLEEFLQAGGGDLDGRLGIHGGREPARVRIRGGVDGTIFRWADTELSGVYRLTVGADPREYLFAVNVPAAGSEQRASESDLARVNKDQLQAAYPSWDFQLVTKPGDVRHADAPGGGAAEEETKSSIGPEVARWVLFGLLIFLLLEPILALVFAHHSTTGVNERKPTSWLLPGIVGGVALLFLGPIFYTLIHGAATGNFLGFLPDGFRGWIETTLDVPAVRAGESRLWTLEFTSWLVDVKTDIWIAAGLAVFGSALVIAMYVLEGAKSPGLDVPVAAFLRIAVILLTVFVLFFQLAFRPDAREQWPSMVLLIDDTKSMGVPDYYREDAVQAKAQSLGELFKAQLQERLPARIASLKAERDEKERGGDKAAAARLTAVVEHLEGQAAQVTSPDWRPTRLQLVQALLGRDEPDWVKTLLSQRRMKVHIFHLDGQGRLIRLEDARGAHVGEITDESDPSLPGQARAAIGELRPRGEDSRLGTAVRQVLDYYRGTQLTGVIMLTDGVTTKDETLKQVSEYAGQRGVPLFFVGVGDDHDVRDLKLHDLQVEDTVYVEDNVIFEARLTGRGYKDLKVPVVLKVRQKDGKEKELMRTEVNVDARGNPVKVVLKDQPKVPGEWVYIVEAEVPKSLRGDKAPNPTDLRLQRSVFVQEGKQIKVLFIEGTPRWEWRHVKFLLERESADKKKKKRVELKVLLTDADDNFPRQDDTAVANFPATKEELFTYDVVILGDVDPRSPKLGEERLRQLADFVREKGGGLLMIAGPEFSPHAYKGTALADVLPIEPLAQPAEPEDRAEGFRPELTALGLRHQIFRFSSNDAENLAIWQRLPLMYWYSEGYRAKPLAEVLAVHPTKKAEAKGKSPAEGHPLVVQQFVGAGRCMFFGFDETWRWHFREDVKYFNDYWNKTALYLSRSRASRTTIRLDRQTPYRVGEPIKVTVQFPDSRAVPGQPEKGGKIEVKVLVEHKPLAGQQGETEIQTMQLAKVAGSYATYEGVLVRTREGKYKFTLTTPDVSKQQPSGERPYAEGIVVNPPGELDRLRMNVEELKQAAEATEGKFYTLATADRVLDDLPTGVRTVTHTQREPLPLWANLFVFALLLGMLGGEWVLRKRKHLL